MRNKNKEIVTLNTEMKKFAQKYATTYFRDLLIEVYKHKDETSDMMNKISVDTSSQNDMYMIDKLALSGLRLSKMDQMHLVINKISDKLKLFLSNNFPTSVENFILDFDSSSQNFTYYKHDIFMALENIEYGLKLHNLKVSYTEFSDVLKNASNIKLITFENLSFLVNGSIDLSTMVNPNIKEITLHLKGQFGKDTLTGFLTSILEAFSKSQLKNSLKVLKISSLPVYNPGIFGSGIKGKLKSICKDLNISDFTVKYEEQGYNPNE